MLARVIKRQRSPAWPVQPNRDLPAKSTCDQLVAAYLRTIETVYRILHVPSFQRTYESIWENDAEPNMAFVVTLKLVLAIGATVYDENMSLRAEAIHWIYEAHVWLSMPTFKSQLGIQYIQNSILLLLARELVNVGADLVWISAGAVYRAAIYIGLHKDPSELPTMPLLEAEMRRRVWNTLLELSMQTSLLSGGPVLFSQEGFNTAPPRNFDDEQLLDAHAVPKDEGVFTQTSIAIALRKTLPIRLAILKFLNEIAPSGTYEETLRIDTELKTAHKAMRRTLHGYTAHANCSPSQFALQVTDFIMQRYLFCLHTPFYAPALKDPMFAYSRKAAVESSLRAWSLAYPKLTDAIYAMGEPDLARMCRCTMGFFRMHAFQASSLLASEWRMRLEDEEDDTDVMSSLLSVVAEDASTWYLGCVQAGETGIKGYLLLRLLEAWNDAIKRRVETSHVPTLLVEALRQATEICIPILERAAGAQEQWSNSSGVDGLRDMGGFDYQPFTETAADWDMIMLETFNLDGLESFDAFAS
ncbi:uncharacterized protein yc1106_05988 [Curvularia clavata]|uniref:Xylanolytic transcriptional activator regulatory domain-containing protein n=1 Tax=Curvularia clavata TaxID=95742 RepID=A0A9Q9DUE0_CURCL|nr:uncharacterized protein yc1106_05988 [Curvularia clavata]